MKSNRYFKKSNRIAISYRECGVPTLDFDPVQRPGLTWALFSVFLLQEGGGGVNAIAVKSMAKVCALGPVSRLSVRVSP